MGNEIFVIYLTKDINYGQSHTFAALKDIDGISIILCDNSSNNYLNNFVEQYKNFKYLPMGYNAGKRIAITKAIEYIDTVRQTDAAVFVIEEGNTVDREFFTMLNSEIANEKVYLPDITVNGKSTGKNGYNGIIFKRSLFDLISLPQTVYTSDIDGNFWAQIQENNIQAKACPKLKVNKEVKDLTPEQIEWNRRFSW